MLDGKRATCFPGFETQLGTAEYTGAPVEVDGMIITSKGAGCALQFARAIAEKLKGTAKADKVWSSMQCD